jgi:hypothetical protein
MPARIIIPNGTRFAKLVVVAYHSRNHLGRDSYECRCDCGKTKIVLAASLRSGNTKSCGCLQPETVSRTAATHGMSRPGHRAPEYSIWAAMKARCYNPNTEHYKDYGGRGIIVCQEWRESFETFIQDIGKRPSAKHSIERIDHNGNYEPSNVKWATTTEQTRNTRRNVMLTLNGETHCIADWSKILGFGRTRIWNRLKAGWSPEKALTTPIDVTMAHNVKRR